MSHHMSVRSYMREQFGVPEAQALKEARAAAKKSGQETFMFFLKRDYDCDPVSRYDWGFDHERDGYYLWVDDKRVVWHSSED